MKPPRENIYFVDGLPVPETPQPGEKPAPWRQTRVIGKARPRVDAYERVSGTAVYPSDVILPKMLYGAILRCPHPHAKVRRVDLTAATRLPGVHAAISGDSLKVNPEWEYRTFGGPTVKSLLFDPHCRHEGEVVAAVAAETPYLARDALAGIQVDYDVLPFVTDEQQALAPDAPVIHGDSNRVGPPQVYQRGDVAKGFGEADVVLTETYHTACELHTPMELHGCVAEWDGDRLTIWESTQGVFAVQSGVAKALGLPLSKVRIIGRYMGGGFGSKLVAGKYTVIAAILARQIGRPVKLVLSREETYLAVGNRPPNHMALKAGVKKDGRLTALDFTGTGSGGAYPAGGTSLLDWQVRDLYTCPNVRCETTDVYIHAGPARPFRAPGHPQGSWALEQMMDALAHAIKMDPVQLRLKNIPAFSQARDGQPPYTTTGFAACLQEGAKAFDWQQARLKPARGKADEVWLRGVGMAGASWFLGAGFGPATVVLRVFADGSVNLNMGAADIGTGTKTVMAMVVAEELGIKSDMIQIEHADTGSTQFSGPSGGSKTVPTDAPAARAAAVAVKRQLLAMAAVQLEEKAKRLTIRDGRIHSTGASDKAVGIAELKELKRQGVIVGVGQKGPRPEGKVVVPFAAQFCEVAVNRHTGELKIVRFLGANDSGRVMSRLTYDNQVYGGITMGIGFGTTEKRYLDHGQTGKLVNRNWHDYKLPTALDVPVDMTSLPIEMPDDQANIVGAKGLGEPVTIPTAAAIANAVFHATGIRVTTTPINPVQLSRLLAQHRKKE